MDLFAATIAGLDAPAANIVADYAATAFPGNEATIAGRGRIGSAPGAALANACAANALAIAEYHAPLAPIMDCVRHPAMVKDGIHWGAFLGVVAAQLAARGFTGMPATLYADEYHATMQTLGTDWWIERIYYKFHPCCRWPAPLYSDGSGCLK